MKLLALDSSGLVASVALLWDGTLIGEYTTNYRKTHSQTLLPMVDAIVTMTGVSLEDLDAIAVASGPGSFTGLRIGSATAKGLGLALGKPIVPVPTLEGLAYNFFDHAFWGREGGDSPARPAAGPVLCPILDARRSQVYAGLYRFRDGEMEILGGQEAAPIDDVVEKVNGLGQETVFLGDGVPVFSSYIREHCFVPYSFAPPHLAMQRAGAVAVLAERYFAMGKAESAAEHRPTYLRPSQAEREKMERERQEKRERPERKETEWEKTEQEKTEREKTEKQERPERKETEWEKTEQEKTEQGKRERISGQAGQGA